MFTFGDVSYRIDPRDIVGEPLGVGNLCRSHIIGAMLSIGDVWIMGVTFLRNVYTVFDTHSVAIGFVGLS